MDRASFEAIRARLDLAASELRRDVDPAASELRAPAPPAAGEGPRARTRTFGQPRAIEALAFGLEVHARGFHVYVAGPEGTGRKTLALEEAGRVAKTLPTPRDCAYVHAFDEPDRPRALMLPPGRASKLAAEMDAFVEAAERAIRRAFEGDDYAKRERAAVADLARAKNELLDELRARVKAHGFSLETSDGGFAITPTWKGAPVDDDLLASLASDERAALEETQAEIEEAASGTHRKIRALESEGITRIRALDEEVARHAVQPLFDDLEKAWSDVPSVLAWLASAEKHLPRQWRAFVEDGDDDEDAPGGDAEGAPKGDGRKAPKLERYACYRVHVLVSHATSAGAPVVFERSPRVETLLGRIDPTPAASAPAADFGRIKPGALHRANGGFLVLRAEDVMGDAAAFAALERALVAGEVRVDTPGEQLVAVAASTLSPDPVPLDVKVVLVGSPLGYAVAYHGDEDFRELFQVKVDFAPDMPASPENVAAYAAFVRGECEERALVAFDDDALARVVEEGMRLAEDRTRLSASLRELAALATETSFWARRAGRERAGRADVETALDRRRRRANLVEERLHAELLDGTIGVETSGERVGQVNATAVIDLGPYAFAHPTRVTATVGVGHGVVTSIERETELGGPLHTKGVLTLQGWLASRFGRARPLALAATLGFEQSYDEIDGDSASCAEVVALVSALADAPSSQGLAITGAVDQTGRVQAVGGVARKIEGFFALCRARGLDGTQGVVVPRANVAKLQLSREVVDAVREGRFHVFAVREVDEAIALATGLDAAEVDARAGARLDAFVDAARTLVR